MAGEAEAGWGRSVLHLQEIGQRLSRGQKWGHLYQAAGADTGVGVPWGLTARVRRASTKRKEFTAVQIDDTVHLSAHLPPVESRASLARAQAVLDEVTATLEGWQSGGRRRQHLI